QHFTSSLVGLHPHQSCQEVRSETWWRLELSPASWPMQNGSTNPPLLHSNRNANRATVKGSPVKTKSNPEDAGQIEYESPLQVVLYPDPRLRAKNKIINVFDEKLQQLVQEMFDIMYKTDGVGLAAPQVGVNVRLMVYNPVGERGQGEEYVLVNPQIVKYGKNQDVFAEGCLSFPTFGSDPKKAPTIEADVERPKSVRVEAQDIKGKKFAMTLKEWQARIFQHEYDHLEGTLYFDRMSPEVLDSIQLDLKKLEELYEQRTGLPAPEKISNRK
ncbi:unnamed protein product, partial [Sphagnum jensenii]